MINLILVFECSSNQQAAYMYIAVRLATVRCLSWLTLDVCVLLVVSVNRWSLKTGSTLSENDTVVHTYKDCSHTVPPPLPFLVGVEGGVCCLSDV